MPIASTTAIMIGAGLTAFSAISQGRAAASEAAFAANIRQQQAAREREIAREEERDFRKAHSAFLAQRRADMGASGVELGTGTPLMTFADFAAEAELQALRIRKGGQTRSTRLEQEAALFRKSGKSARRQGLFRAGASLLTGGLESGLFGSPTSTSIPSIATDARGPR